MTNRKFGLRSVEFNCIVKEEKVPEKIGSIILTEAKKDEDQHKQTVGTLVSVAPTAFTYEQWPEDRRHEMPKPGDRVIYAKYGGSRVEDNITFIGKDPNYEYRIIKDKDILAVIEE